ncbi:MAG: hypothetical protein QM809_06990 [Gordonia sp. (in: high G+C Gram-positive bacteria)]|uniref:hypothetical protein n=1 Tax=Gordonia sp. (in: high G+C Gram-positive bacteria) TaxID=84139 RepID=UPI0039E503C7
MTVPSPPPRPPAPGPTSPPGEKPARPDSITVVIQLAVVVVICRWVVVPSMYSDARTDMIKQATEMKDAVGIQDVERFSTVMTIAALVLGAVMFAALAAAAVLLVVRGFWWARFLLGWMAVVIGVDMVFAVSGYLFGDGASADPLPQWTMIPRILMGVAAVGVLPAVMHPDTKKYVEAVEAHRRGGRRTGQRSGR